MGNCCGIHRTSSDSSCERIMRIRREEEDERLRVEEYLRMLREGVSCTDTESSTDSCRLTRGRHIHNVTPASTDSESICGARSTINLTPCSVSGNTSDARSANGSTPGIDSKATIDSCSVDGVGSEGYAADSEPSSTDSCSVDGVSTDSPAAADNKTTISSRRAIGLPSVESSAIQRSTESKDGADSRDPEAIIPMSPDHRPHYGTGHMIVAFAFGIGLGLGLGLWALVVGQAWL